MFRQGYGGGQSVAKIDVLKQNGMGIFDSRIVVCAHKPMSFLLCCNTHFPLDNFVRTKSFRNDWSNKGDYFKWVNNYPTIGQRGPPPSDGAQNVCRHSMSQHPSLTRLFFRVTEQVFSLAARLKMSRRTLVNPHKNHRKIVRLVNEKKLSGSRTEQSDWFLFSLHVSEILTVRGPFWWPLSSSSLLLCHYEKPLNQIH
jgi:hypothetical protein